MNNTPDIAIEAERLAKLAAETGDARLWRAAAVLADADPRDYRREVAARGRRMRDDAIREMAGRFFPGLEPWPKAGEIARRMQHYATRGDWRDDQHAGTCPGLAAKQSHRSLIP